MPAFLKTPADEAAWEKAKARAKEQGKAENWAYTTAIWKNMVGKEASVPSAQRVASRFLSAYDEKGRDPDGGWEHGEVEPFQPTDGTGSQTPPSRDNQGHPLDLPDLGTLEIPGYEWHDTSKAFHDNPPGDAEVPRVDEKTARFAR